MNKLKGSRNLIVAACLVSLGVVGVSGGSAVASSKAHLSGKPVLIGLMYMKTGADSSPALDEEDTGAIAAQDYINSLGGFGGRPAKVIACDTQSTTAGAVTCANELAADGVVFVDGFALGFPDALPIFSKHHIPIISVPVTPQEYSNPDSMPIFGGSLGEYSAEAWYGVNVLHSTNGAFVEEEAPAGDSPFPYMQPYFTKVGGTLTDVQVPLTSADLSPEIAQIVQSKATVVLTELGAAADDQLFPALQAAGYKPDQIVSQGSALDIDNFLNTVKPQSAINGMIFTAEFDSFDDVSNVQVKDYRAASEKYEHTNGRGALEQWSFATLMTAYDVAKTMGFSKFNGTSMTKWFHTKIVPIYMGYQYNLKVAPKADPSVGDPYVHFIQYKNGKLVNLPQPWVDSINNTTVPYTYHS
jgi:branched-chain amino acid transport system substrate-binding protein